MYFIVFMVFDMGKVLFSYCVIDVNYFFVVNNVSDMIVVFKYIGEKVVFVIMWLI